MSTRGVARWLSSVAWTGRRALSLAVGGALVRQGGFLAMPAILAYAVDDAVTTGDVPAGARWAAVLVAAAVVQFLGMCVWDWYANAADARAGALLRSRLLERLWLRDRADPHREVGSGDLVLRASRDVDIVRVWVHGLPTWSVIALTIAVLVPGIFDLDPMLLIVAMATVPLLIVLNLVYPGRFERASAAAAQAHGDRADVVEHLLRSAVTTRGIGAEHVLRDRHHERSAALVADTVRAGGILARWTALGEGIPAVATAVGLLVGVVAVGDGRLTVGGLVAFSGWMGTIGIAVQVGLARAAQTVQARVSARRLIEVLGPEPVIRRSDPPVGAAALANPAVPADPPHLTASVATPSGPVEVDLRAGEILAVGGPTGSGKSTLLTALAGWANPAAGTVRLDAVPLADWRADRLAREMILVPQRPIVMAGTVRENLELGESHDPARLTDALRATGLDRDLGPGALDVVVGDGGGTLSGGQIQRLAVARALVAGPRVLLLDDVTSAVDAASEAVLVQAIREFARDRIVVVTGHRTALLDAATVTLTLRGATTEDSPSMGRTSCRPT
jgi:ATP-binding cassette subfamily B protein